ncbi:hypothetical protein Efla_002245 [Eimeria flavescens]
MAYQQSGSNSKLVHQQQQQQQQNPNSSSSSGSDSTHHTGLVRLACQWSRRSPLPPQQQGHQQLREQGPLLGLSYSCQHQLADGLEPVKLRRGVPPLLGGGPGVLTGGPLALQQLEAESSDLAAAAAVAAESAGERPAAAAAAAGSPHCGPAIRVVVSSELLGRCLLYHFRCLLTGMVSPFASPTDFCLWLTDVVKDALVAPKQQQHNLLLSLLHLPPSQSSITPASTHLDGLSHCASSSSRSSSSAVGSPWRGMYLCGLCGGLHPEPPSQKGEVLGSPVHAGEDLNPRRAAAVPAGAGAAAAAAVAVGLKNSEEGAPLSSLSSSSSSRSNRDGWWSSSLGGLSTPEGPAPWEERPLRPQRPELYTRCCCFVAAAAPWSLLDPFSSLGFFLWHAAAVPRGLQWHDSKVAGYSWVTLAATVMGPLGNRPAEIQVLFVNAALLCAATLSISYCVVFFLKATDLLLVCLLHHTKIVCCTHLLLHGAFQSKRGAPGGGVEPQGRLERQGEFAGPA